MKTLATTCRAALSALVLSFAGFASAATVVIDKDTTWTAADVDKLDPADVISINQGVRLQFDTSAEAIVVPQVITGKGSISQKANGSYRGRDLTLLGDNTFEGGYYSGYYSVVRAKNAHAFGTGLVKIESQGWVCLQADNATFANDFKFYSSSSAKARIVFVHSSNDSKITVSGKVTAEQHLVIATSYGSSEPSPNPTGCSIVFDNEIVVKDGSDAKQDLTICGYLKNAKVYFNQKITSRSVRNCNAGATGLDANLNGTGSSGTGYVYFYAANDVDLFVPYGNVHYPMVAGAFPATCSITSADWRNDGSYRAGSTVDFGGLSVEVGALPLIDAKANGLIKSDNTSFGALKSDSPATLTVSGGGSYVTDAIIKDRLSFDWNPADDGTLLVSNRQHTTTEKFTVSKGTLLLYGGSSAKNLSVIEVKADACFKLETTVANALNALGWLNVAADGVFEVAAGATPLSGSTVAELATGAKIVLGDGVTANFGLVVTNGVPVADGTYTSGDWLELGEGASVSVQKSNFAANTWIKAASGNWTETASWSKDAVPSSSYATALTVPGASYKVTLDDGAKTIKQLYVYNEKAAQTATLTITNNASLQVGDGTKGFNVGQGGIVDVTADGALTMTAGSVVDGNIRAWVHDGGQINVAGSMEALSHHGQFVVEEGGKIALTGDGTLAVTPGTANLPSALTIGKGGTLTATGNVQVLVSGYNWGQNSLVVEKGGTLDVSGNAVVGLRDKGTASRIFGDGTMTFRENSTFGRTATGAGAGWRWQFAAGSGAPTGTVTFLDHASFIDTASGLYLDRGNGLTARLELYSDSKSHTFAWQTIFGGVGARGECVITNGALTIVGPGLWLGGIASRGTKVADAVSEGYFRASGDASVNMSVNNDATGTFNGLLIGDCSRATVNPDTGKYYQDTRRGLMEIADNATLGWGYGSPEIMLGVGSTNAFGRLVQSGGTISAETVSGLGHVVVGVGGGQGEWVMTGGEVKMPLNVYVGGATLADLNKTVETLSEYAGTDADHVGKAKGLLKLLGGTFTIGRNSSNLRNLVLSSDGVGTLYLGKDANLKVNGQLIANTGSKLVVDMRGCTDKSKTLATFGGTAKDKAFDPANITLLQDETTSYRLDVTATGITAKNVKGLVMIIK